MAPGGSDGGEGDGGARWKTGRGQTVSAGQLNVGQLRAPDLSSRPAPTGSGNDSEIHAEPYTWREKLWTVPEETRIGAYEMCEALGRTKSWLYHRTGPSAKDRIPHRKLDGELVFVVGDVREWLRRREVRVR